MEALESLCLCIMMYSFRCCCCCFRRLVRLLIFFSLSFKSFTVQHSRIMTLYRFVAVGSSFFHSVWLELGFQTPTFNLDSKIYIIHTLSLACACECLFGLEFNKRISNSYDSNVITPRVYLIFVL